ncbi:hypothetical protein GCM10027290_38460 [Micromonospora sonneratiae]|uniref:OmpA family protein n=1 Tax=Micromonospora sonneratiae TaxID=1184706 RepID=A0ABW3Y7Q5_9ACTN
MRLGRVLVVVASVVALGATAGCGADEPDCSRPADEQVDGVGNTAILIDVSASTRSTGAAPQYPTVLAGQIEAAVDRQDVVSIGTFDGSAATVGWTTDSRPTRSNSKRPNNRKADREKAISCLSAAAREAASAPARAARTDVLGALGVAAEHTGQAGQQRRTVILATDGLSTTGCADLSRRPVGDQEFIEAMATACPGKPDWPTALNGVHVVMLGVGHPAEGQPVPETGHLAWLRTYWERVCLLAQAASCTVSTAPVQRATGKQSDGAPADAPVAFTPGAGPPAVPDRTVLPLPSATLFDTDSDQVGAEGRQRLVTLALEVGVEPGTTVEVIGHTDSRSDDAYNQDLSERRAAAVGQVLRGEGFTQVRTRGEGEKRLLCPHERRPDGTWDDQCLQQNRRVEIVLTRGGG